MEILVIAVAVIVIPFTVGYLYSKHNVNPNTPEGVVYYKRMN